MSWYNDYVFAQRDAQLTAPPAEPDPVEMCTSCGCELYEGDYLWTIAGEKLCEECLNDGYRRML